MVCSCLLSVVRLIGACKCTTFGSKPFKFVFVFCLVCVTVSVESTCTLVRLRWALNRIGIWYPKFDYNMYHSAAKICPA